MASSNETLFRLLNDARMICKTKKDQFTIDNEEQHQQISHQLANIFAPFSELNLVVNEIQFNEYKIRELAI